MELNDWRVFVMVVSFAAFVAMIFWVYRRGRKEAFDRAAEIALADGPLARAARHDGENR